MKGFGKLGGMSVSMPTVSATGSGKIGNSAKTGSSKTSTGSSKTSTGSKKVQPVKKSSGAKKFTK